MRFDLPDFMNDPKRHGLLTTEFWFNVLLSVLVYFLHVPVYAVAGGHPLLELLAFVLPAVIKLLVIGALGFHYTQGRLDIKLASEQWPPAVLELPPEVMHAIRSSKPAAPDAPPHTDA